MTIKQLLDMPIGQKTGGFLLTVKTAKKHWEVPNKDGQTVGHKGQGRVLHQQAILTDETGDMIADIKILSPEHGNQCDTIKVGAIIRVIVCEIQTAYDKRGDTPEPNKKLFIDQFAAYIKDSVVSGNCSSEYDYYDIPGRCKTWHIAAFIQGYAANTGRMPECTEGRMKAIDKWVDFNAPPIMTGD